MLGLLHVKTCIFFTVIYSYESMEPVSLSSPHMLAHLLLPLSSTLHISFTLYAYSPLPFTCTANRSAVIRRSSHVGNSGQMGYLECSSDQLLSCGRFPTTRFGALGRGFLKSGARIHLYRITIAGPTLTWRASCKKEKSLSSIKRKTQCQI